MLNEVLNLPLLPAQEGVLFAERAHGRPGTHNIALALQLSGPLDTAALHATLHTLTARHEALRTAVVAGADGARQVIAPEVTVPVAHVDLGEVDEAAVAGLLGERFAEAQDRPFRLYRAPLLRVTLFRLGALRHVLLLVMHHGIADGASVELLAGEFAVLYEAFAEGRPDPLGPPRLRYADHVTTAYGSAGPGRRRERALAYWTAELAGAPATLDLPMARLNGTTRRQAGTHRRDVPRPVVARLRAIAEQQRATLFSALAAGAFALFMRYTGERDIVLGAPLSTRLEPGLEELVALAVNTLPLRVRCEEDADFRTLLRQVQGRTLQALRHQSVPFHELVQALNPPRAHGRQPLFQLGLNHGQAGPAPVPRAGLLVEHLPVANTTAAFELMLTFIEDDQDAWIYLEYDTGRFAVAAVEAMADHLLHLLDGVSADPSAPIITMELMGEQERRQVVHGWNDTAAPIADATIPELLAAQVRRHGDEIAVVCGDERLSYRELDERVGRLARLLASRGVGEGAFVGLSLPRSAAMVVAVLAVLRAGAAYVPLDPAYPPERLAFMVEDAAPALIITDGSVAGGLPAGPGTPVLALDDPAILAETAAYPDGRFDRSFPADRTAYVIYTSGSTGQPKGVVVTHRNVANLAAWAGEAFGAGLARVLAATSLNFDVSVFEILGPLLNGGGIEIVRDLLEIGERGGWEGTLVSGVPSVLARLIADSAPLIRTDYLVLAGEQLTSQVAAVLRAALPGTRLVNAYGPTEATVYASASTTGADEEAAPPIGRPLRNTRLYVLDDRLCPVPVGVPGGLYIAGTGVARGYLNRPDLTESRFVPDPYGPADTRMYRSGDVVQRRPDGQLEFLGRADDQVKLRGFRVEPGEVEAVLLRQPEVAQAAVVVHQDRAGERRLVGYVVPARGIGLDPTRVRAATAQVLPEYMIPVVVPVDALPLSPSGKLDRARLPDPAFTPFGGRPARTRREIALAELFAEVLGLPEVSATHGFFDLGGHSLMAIRLVGRICAELGANVTVRDLLETPTVEGLARRLDRTGRDDDFTVLLTLQEGGTRPPLFCVHPGFGLGWSYAALLRRLGPDQPVYGIQARGLLAGEELPSSYDELVIDYLRQIRAVRPHGPYRLLGWSFGGLAAHTVAARLQAAGQEVDFLALLDTVLPSADEVNPELDEQWRLIEQETAAVREVVPDPNRLLRVVGNLLRLRAEFAPERFDGDVVFVTAAEEPDRTASISAPWLPYVGGRIEEHRVACAHLDMMAARPAHEIGDIIAKALAGRPRQR